MLILFATLIIFIHICIMKVIEGDNYDVYIYPNDHPPPHCHIRYCDEEESVVGLPLLNHLNGVKVIRKVHKELINNIILLSEKWEELNPDIHNYNYGNLG